MKTAAVIAAVLVVALSGGASARADVGARLWTTTVSVGQMLRGSGAARMPLYLVPEAHAPRPYSCRGGTAFCTPRSRRAPGTPFVFVGTIGRRGGEFALRVPNVRPGRYQVALWCRACGGSLILAGATMYGQVVVVRPRSDVVRLVALSPRRVAHCRRSQLLAPICPRRVPRVGAPYLAHLARDLTGRPSRLDVFNLERGGERPGRPERNRPPAMAHVVLAAGEVKQLAPIWQNGVKRAQLIDTLMRERRAHLLRLGTRTWAGRKGWLELAPPFLRGGMLGNHLIFRWRGRAREYLVSLHAWEPLTEAVDVLRAVVASSRSP